MPYPLLKLIHILSATLMVGTGLGSAFYLYYSYKKYSTETFRDVLKLVILADWIFTTPSVVVQLVTGLWLSQMLGLTYSGWFWLSLSVSAIVLVLWIAAVVIQYRLDALLTAGRDIRPQADRWMRLWFLLGIPAFLGAIFLYYWMVYKPFMVR